MNKAIIIAAGTGSRLLPMTKDTPKTLLKVGSKTILDTQIDALKKANINDINIIVGYKSDKFLNRNEKLFHNLDFLKNNILESLFYAESALNGDCLISYSDIIFKPKIVQDLIKSDDPISIVTDKDWEKSYINRTMHPHDEAEKAQYNEHNNLVKIGKSISMNQTNAEFIGMLKLNPEGCKIFKEYYKIAKDKYLDKQFFSAKTFKQSYITDFLSYLIYNNIMIKCIHTEGNWMEIDTIEDYEKAQSFF